MQEASFLEGRKEIIMKLWDLLRNMKKCMQEVAEMLKDYGGILRRKGSGSWAVFGEDYPGWYLEAMSNEDATGVIYRAWGPLIIRVLYIDFLNICKAVADKVAVLFICT